MVSEFTGIVLPLMGLGIIPAVLVVWLIFRVSRPLTPQKRSRVYIRSPHWDDESAKPPRWAYDAEEHVAEAAEEFHEYAALAAASYEDNGVTAIGDWKRCEEFPDADTKQKSEEVDLQSAVWEKSGGMPIVAVVFRGTEPSNVLDWAANFRWFRWIWWILRSKRDQYDVVQDVFAHRFQEHLKKRWAMPAGPPKFELVAVGHSLGAGLAQHFAYTLPEDVPHGTRVSKVYAFAASPVTGYLGVRSKTLRNTNAEKLSVYHVFEHGEILAFLRLLLGTATKRRGRFPLKWTFRFNLSKSANPVKSHSIAGLAKLLDQFRKMEPTKKVKKPERVQQLQLIYDYIKFHIGLYIGTPPVLLILAEGLGVTKRAPFVAGMADMIFLYMAAGMHAGWFMGTHVNRQWASDFLDEFEQSAFTAVRRFFHHWMYWAGLVVGLAGLLLSLSWPDL